MKVYKNASSFWLLRVENHHKVAYVMTVTQLIRSTSLLVDVSHLSVNATIDFHYCCLSTWGSAIFNSSSIIVTGKVKYDSPIHRSPIHRSPIHYNTIHFNPIYHNLIHYNTIHFNPIHHNLIHYNLMHYNPIHHNLIHYNPIHDDPIHHQYMTTKYNISLLNTSQSNISQPNTSQVTNLT